MKRDKADAVNESRGSVECGQMVRRFDHDRFLCALFAPLEARRALDALFALNVELASIVEKTSEALLGEIRLQWWRDNLEGIFSANPPPPKVAGEVSWAVEKFSLPRQDFEDMIEARSFDLFRQPPDDLSALENYLENTAGRLHSLAQQVLDPSGTGAGSVRHVALAFGLCGIIRAIPFHAGQGRVYLPHSLLRREGVKTDFISAEESRQPVARITEELAARAWKHLEMAAQEESQPGRAAEPIMLPGILARRTLKRLSGCGFNPFDPRMMRGDPMRAGGLCLHMLKAAFAGRG